MKAILESLAIGFALVGGVVAAVVALGYAFAWLMRNLEIAPLIAFVVIWLWVSFWFWTVSQTKRPQ